MTRVTISAPDGRPGDVTVCVDGVPISHISRYAVEQRAGDGPPVVVLEVIATHLAVNLPDAMLAALDVSRTDAAAVDAAEDALTTRFLAPLPGAERYAMLETQAIAGTQLEGVDVATLAEEWTLLAPASRATVLRALDVPMEIAANEGPMVDAFAAVHDAGKLREFAAAVTRALREGREGAIVLDHSDAEHIA